MKRFLFLILSCASCVSPYSISKMKPEATNTFWSWGREFASQTADSITVRVAFENNNRHDGIFNVEIENNSGKPILVAPEKFQVTLKGIGLPKQFTGTQPARDPESLFLDLEKQTARHNAEETNTAILHAVGFVTETATNVASLAVKETPEQQQDRHEAQKETDYQRQLDSYNLEVARLNLNEQKQYYHNNLLRKTTLPPNSIITGQVHFPHHSKASHFEIIIPVAGQVLKFPFSHTVVLP